MDKTDIDIIFLVDCSTGNQSLLNAIHDNVEGFFKELVKTNFEPRFAFIEFGNFIKSENIYVHFFIKENNSSKEIFTQNPKEFRNLMMNLECKSDGKHNNSLDALIIASKQKFKQFARKILILITGLPPLMPSNLVKSLSQVISSLKNRGIDQLYIISDLHNQGCSVYLNILEGIKKFNINGLGFEISNPALYQTEYFAKVFKIGIIKGIEKLKKKESYNRTITKGTFTEQLRKKEITGELQRLSTSQKIKGKIKSKIEETKFANQLAQSQIAKKIQTTRIPGLTPIKLNIQVTTPGYDYIGEILERLKIPYKKFDDTYDCDLLFLNCGTDDLINPDNLSHFVNRGSILYASDLTSSLISQSFPGKFMFKGNFGIIETVTAKVTDPELRDVIGSSVKIEFDMGSWSILESISSGKVILLSSKTQLPLMVSVPIGRGQVFYTCFHNHAQASRQEEILLELLVLKQIGAFTSMPLDKTCKTLGIDLDSIKSEIKGIK